MFVLLGTFYPICRIAEYVIVFHSIGKCLMENCVIMDDRIGGIALFQNFVIEHFDVLRFYFCQKQIQLLKMRSDTSGDHIVITFIGGSFHQRFYDFQPFIHIIRHQKPNAVHIFHGFFRFVCPFQVLQEFQSTTLVSFHWQACADRFLFSSAVYIVADDGVIDAFSFINTSCYHKISPRII